MPVVTRSDVLTLPAEALVHECLTGDEAAWRDLHRRYYPIAGSFLRKLGVKELELDDALQDVFVQLFRYLGQFRGEADLKTWLYRLCVTQARRTRRRFAVAETLRRVLALFPSDALLASPGFSDERFDARIQLALSALSPTERDVFVLYELEGIPGKQIAEIVGCPEASVWRRLHYARRSFKAALLDKGSAGAGAGKAGVALEGATEASSSPVIKRAPRS